MNENKLKFIITIGISGSGKSTWVNEMKNLGYVIVSPDNIRSEITGDISNQSKNNEVFKIAFQRIIDALNNNKNVILDATNIDSYYRKNMLEYIKNNVKNEFEAFAKIFYVNPEIAKKRISDDIKNKKNRANVPDHVIDKQYKIFIRDLSKIKTDGYKILK